MKKNFLYAMMSAIALTGAVSFSACSSNEEMDGTPVIVKEDIGKGVVTKFALNLSQTQGSANTRMTPNVVQLTPGTNNFRGMSDIWLIPMNFALAGNPDLLSGNYSVSVGSTAVEICNNNQNFNNSLLGTDWNTVIYNLGDIAPNEISQSQSSKVYSMTLPVGTSNFLFYGKAIKSVDDNDTQLLANAKNGVLTSTLSQNVAKAKDITFSLQPIYSSISSNSIADPMSTLLTILNGIESASDATEGNWNALSTSTVNSEITLKQAYNGFAKTKPGEVRAGSAEAIRVTVQELYRTVLAQSRVGQTDKVKKIALAVRNKIEEYFDIYFDTDAATEHGFDTEVAAADIDELEAGNYKYNYYDAFLKYKNSNPSNKTVTNFPIEQGLPSGAARLFTDGTSPNVFSYAENDNTGVTTGDTGNDIKMISYPAELSYFANSALRATENNKEVKDYPITVSSWDANSLWGDWPLPYVTTDTRAVAMKNNVNYGVAMLKSQVKLPANTTLADNRATIIGDGITTDNDITINDKSFIMTGIVIGGQPDNVGWDFLPTSPSNRDHVVYDRILSKDGTNNIFDTPTFPDNTYTKTENDAADYCFVTTSGTPFNYTMLLDNHTTETAQKADIAVAIELVNNTGQEFYGRDNIIPVGGTFYLAGKLTLASGTGTVDWASYTNTSYTATPNEDYKYRIPAYGINRIFIQDHTTLATFTLGVDALKHAYSTVPDLRSIQMLFGLSVDLQWLNGLEFDVNTL